MKVVILAGGFGTRLAELTSETPKPMVPIGGKPILWHIMTHYASYGYNEFILALGYKAEIIKDYFLNYAALNSDFTINLDTGIVESHSGVKESWKITLVDTGINSMTGGRLKRLSNIIGDETFMMTYGDGLSDVNITKLSEAHQANGCMVTVTTVRPGARFGELKIHNEKVMSFKEKPQTSQGWINGGFFVMDSKFMNYIDSDETVLEAEPLELAAKNGELGAYKHEGFWQPMDTIRDRHYLDELWQAGNAPWRKLN